MPQIYNVDYNDYVEIVGTAHFTRRSINEAYEAIESLKPEDVALELDWRRFRQLNTACLTCPRRESCVSICEFTAATEALGNVNANIWLIDMTEEEMKHRISSKMSPFEMFNIPPRIHRYSVENPVWLWERGFKDRVVNDSKKEIEKLRRIFPSVWQVLIDERNALMSARIVWIASKNLDEGKHPKVLTLVGAAHVEGIKELLKKPLLIKEKLEKFDLPFTKPTLIRRVAIQED